MTLCQVEEPSDSEDEDQTSTPEPDKEKVKNRNRRASTASRFLSKIGIKSKGVVQEMTPEMLKKAQQKELVPIQLHFEDLNFYVSLSKKEQKKTGQTQKQILFDITGTFQPGTLTAIMGPSGAGNNSFSMNYYYYSCL